MYEIGKYGIAIKVLNEWMVLQANVWMFRKEYMKLKTKNLNKVNGLWFIVCNCIRIVKFDCEWGTGWGLKG